MSILQDGFLKPSFAPRTRVTVGGTESTIKGPTPAVCFTEQPLSSFIVSCSVLSDRCHPFAVAVRKDRLFEYGGRPVIYGDEYLLDDLPDGRKYLWVRYNPIPSRQLGGYPVDWTHEREWRVRATKHMYGDLGVWSEEGVPLLLPPDHQEDGKPIYYLPWVIVRTRFDAAIVRKFIADLPAYQGSSKILDLYFKRMPSVPVVSFEDVADAADDPNWARLDTLPIERLDESAATTFVRIGWRHPEGTADQ